jgi:hypothetical protein
VTDGYDDTEDADDDDAPSGWPTVAGTDWPAADVGQVTPSVDDVAALSRTRTVEAGGSDPGTFTTDTQPSDQEVSDLIDQAVEVVLSQLPTLFPAGYYPQVRHAAALYAALLIEGSYFREQLNEGSAQLWRQLYDAAITGLQTRYQVDLKQMLAARIV